MPLLLDLQAPHSSAGFDLLPLQTMHSLIEIIRIAALYTRRLGLLQHPPHAKCSPWRASMAHFTSLTVASAPSSRVWVLSAAGTQQGCQTSSHGIAQAYRWYGMLAGKWLKSALRVTNVHSDMAGRVPMRCPEIEQDCGRSTAPVRTKSCMIARCPSATDLPVLSSGQ